MIADRMPDGEIWDADGADLKAYRKTVVVDAVEELPDGSLKVHLVLYVRRGNQRWATYQIAKLHEQPSIPKGERHYVEPGPT